WRWRRRKLRPARAARPSPGRSPPQGTRPRKLIALSRDLQLVVRGVGWLASAQEKPQRLRQPARPRLLVVRGAGLLDDAELDRLRPQEGRHPVHSLDPALEPADVHVDPAAHVSRPDPLEHPLAEPPEG